MQKRDNGQIVGKKFFTPAPKQREAGGNAVKNEGPKKGMPEKKKKPTGAKKVEKSCGTEREK